MGEAAFLTPVCFSRTGLSACGLASEMPPLPCLLASCKKVNRTRIMVEFDIIGKTYYNIYHQGDKKTLANTRAKVLAK